MIWGINIDAMRGAVRKQIRNSLGDGWDICPDCFGRGYAILLDDDDKDDDHDGLDIEGCDLCDGTGLAYLNCPDNICVGRGGIMLNAYGMEYKVDCPSCGSSRDAYRAVDLTEEQKIAEDTWNKKFSEVTMTVASLVEMNDGANELPNMPMLN